jgi:hypothetical protein
MEIQVDDHRQVLESEIQRHATQEVSLEIVDDVAEWAKAHSVVVTGNPIGTSIPVRGQLPRAVVVRAKLNEEDLSGVLGRLDFRGHWDETRKMRNNPVMFLRHLVLHELAHLENNWNQSMEDDCDEWAFERLAA